mmetsp:Transcript_14342/g.14323  ORF Transcript_14342/g.14323 Transcript_14342/m.14323 type:complete len:173 (-) Transcript_14342:7-525(-)
MRKMSSLNESSYSRRLMRNRLGLLLTTSSSNSGETKLLSTAYQESTVELTTQPRTGQKFHVKLNKDLKTEDSFKDPRRDNKFLVSIMGKIIEDAERTFFSSMKNIWVPKGFKDAGERFRKSKQELQIADNSSNTTEPRKSIFTKIKNLNEELTNLKIKPDLVDLLNSEKMKY